MSARYEFQINQGGRLEISVGGSVVSVSTPESHTFRAIRQQSADIAALKDALAELERAAQTPAPVAEIREPTLEECERISRYCRGYPMADESAIGHAMFDAVKGVLWPKEGL